ncbi:DUF6055 domain-containing protein [Dyadobacter psychrotolerans]|uniref:DUF6055 domain-containing protein n=1 Tax=Dyadobacter psychrotolerans TaxID=2541721 RepID=UPI0015F2D21F|nr:DUF6055 domain-containing protein [Dyadobacter psychrotolerans]
MIRSYLRYPVLLLFLTTSLLTKNHSYVNAQVPASPEKELYLPAKIMRVPEGNDYNSNESEFSSKRMIQSANIAIFWHKEFGDDPMTNNEVEKRFDVNEALKECDRFYDYYVNDLKLVQKGNSATDRYKMILFVINGKEQTAFGGGVENKVGILWTPALRMSKAPYGALAHELGHAFQYISRADSKTGPRGPIMEMSAQYMLWQVYPQWMTFENYHLISYFKKTHFAFLHPENMYHSPYVLEYWSEKHGKEFFGKLCRSTQEGEDPVMTYKRLTGVTQEAFNDEMFDAASRFITWDLKRVEPVARQYANLHTTKLHPTTDGWFEVDSANCPQNYGYNGIELALPAKGTKVTVDFKGISGAQGYSSPKSEKAGWRYGFVAFKKDGSRVYGKVSRDPKGKVEFKVPANTGHLWLVVSAAPTEHWPVSFGRQKTPVIQEQWPYQIKITGTTLSKSE